MEQTESIWGSLKKFVFPDNEYEKGTKFCFVRRGVSRRQVEMVS